MQEDPLLFLAPKDDNNFSYGSFTDYKTLPQPPSMDSKLMNDGQYYSTWFYYQALFCNSFDGFICGKKYVNRAKLTAWCVYTFYR